MSTTIRTYRVMSGSVFNPNNDLTCDLENKEHAWASTVEAFRNSVDAFAEGSITMDVVCQPDLLRGFMPLVELYGQSRRISRSIRKDATDGDPRRRRFRQAWGQLHSTMHFSLLREIDDDRRKEVVSTMHKGCNDLDELHADLMEVVRGVEDDIHTWKVHGDSAPVRVVIRQRKATGVAVTSDSGQQTSVAE